MTVAAPGAGSRSDQGAPPEAVVETRDLIKRYGRLTALDGLTMRVEAGEVFGFLGPNGAGKTTAVKLLLGLATPTSGSGHVLGKPLGDPAARRSVGYLPELFRYQAWLSGREVLRLHCELIRLPRASWEDESDRVLTLVGLADRGGHRVGTYSKGMQQRLGLGVALLGAPRLVVLDEPTSALDPMGRLDVRHIIAALRDTSVTVFLNSHLLGEVERVCDRVAIVDHGRVVTQSRLEDLTADPTVRIRVTGLPDSALPGRAAADGGEWRIVETAPDDIPSLVAELVRRGGQVHAVIPGGTTLEDRFFDLLGKHDG